MGLAASQARLLSITQRISDNELRAQLINNQKMRLNSESSRVSENYINALNKTNLVFANYNSEDEAQNVPLTFKNLTAFNQYNNQYNLTNTAGNVLISEDDARKYKNANGNLERFLKDGYGIEYTTSYWDTLEGQLRNCEAYYSNPDLDGIAEATTTPDFTYTNAAGETVTGDGTYAFFKAAELKEMYEGKGSLASYLDTIKKDEYTDFVDCYDTFFDELAKLRNAQNNFAPTVANLANKIGSIINAGDITVKSDGSIETTKSYTFAAGVFANTATVALTDYIPKNITEESLGFTLDTSTTPNKYTKTLDESWHDITGNDKITDFKTTNANENSYKYLTMNVYIPSRVSTDNLIQIQGNIEENSNGSVNTANTVTWWYNLDDGNIYKLSRNNLGVWQLSNEGNPITDTDTYTDDTGTNVTENIELKVSKDPTSGIITKTETSTVGTDTYSDTVCFDIPTSYSATTKPTITFTDPTTAQNVIKTLVIDYMNTKGLEKIIEDQIKAGNKVTYTGLNSTQLKNINNPPNTTESDSLITKMNELLGFSGTSGPSAYVSDGRQMEAILIALTSGNGLTKNTDGSFNLSCQDPNNPTTRITRTIPSSAAELTNAIVCDTLMDYFGEPVYGYMKKNASNQWIVADEEAQWYINLFEKIKNCGYQVLANGLANSTDWLQFALENGIVVMEQINSEQVWQPITHTSCSDIIEQTDTQAATIAEAEYNKAMRQIEAKDEMFDLELKNIDTEHTSLQSEYESVKKAMTGNIERTFQMYG